MERAQDLSPVDLLLINGSNFPGQAIFPYAFVQVSALARRHGLRIRRLELLPFPRERWRAEIEHAIRTLRPRMVGTHLRQADSQYLPEYTRTPGTTEPLRTYFPVERTRWILETVRELTDAPTVVGGFGFTAQAPRLVEHLRPDLAVQGEPDDFFASFERVLAARSAAELQAIGNLVVRDGGAYRFNDRAFFTPLDSPEYDDEIFAEVLGFYAAMGRSLGIGGPGEADVPVEILRGCPCRCYFCTEPAVKGRRVRRRELDAVMADVAFLGERNVHSVFFICSELNMGGMDYPLELAERMLRFNEGRPGRELQWRAYAMPRPGMSRDDLRTLMRAGYRPGWNEFVSFDDRNLARARMPYRTEHAVRYYRDVLALSDDRTVYRGPRPHKLEMFLGNAFADAATIRTTLGVVDREGFAARHSVGGAISATRVYEVEGKLLCGTEATAFSINEAGNEAGNADGRQPLDPVWPSFHYAPELLRLLGSEAAIEDFLRFVSHTMLSTQYRAGLSTSRFLLGSVAMDGFARLLRACDAGPLCAAMVSGSATSELRAAAQANAEQIWQDPTVAALVPLFAPAIEQRAVAERTLHELLRVLLFLHRPAFAPVLRFLDLPAHTEPDYARLTPYRVMRALYARFDSTTAVIAACRRACDLAEGSVTELHLQYFLYAHGVVIRPSYRELLFE